MTKKDYVKIAAAINATKPIKTESADVAWTGIVLGVARVMEDDNPRFDRARFLQACGA